MHCMYYILLGQAMEILFYNYSYKYILCTVASKAIEKSIGTERSKM